MHIAGKLQIALKQSLVGQVRLLGLGQLHFHLKEQGVFLNQGVTLSALLFSTGVPKLRPQSSTNPLLVNSVSAGMCVGIANLIGGWIPSIFKDKFMEKTQVCDEQLAELGRQKTNCVSLKLKVFNKAVSNI